LNISYETPIKVNVDNIGAKSLSKDKNSGQSTKHINLKNHYVRELVEGKFIEIQFVNCEDNLADLSAKISWRRSIK
jgi:hypothetical protein